MTDELKEKLDELNTRIHDARQNSDIVGNDEKKKNKGPSDEEKKSGRAGAEFIGNLIGGALVGYGFDWLFQTRPIGFLIFMVLGLVSGVLRANAIIINKK